MAEYTLEPIKDEPEYTLEPVETSWRQAPTPTLWEKIKEVFPDDSATQSAKASNALTYSQMLNIAPSVAYEYHDEISKQVQSKLSTEKIITERKGIGGAVSSGIDTSLVGMMARQKVPEPFESIDQIERWIQGMIAMGMDLPFFMAGYAIGGGNPVSGTAGAFGFNAGLRQVLMDRYSKGEVKDAADFFERVGNAAKETIKGEVVGGFVGGAGYMAPAWATKLGMTPSVGWKATLELATMTAAGKLIEGKLPTTQDLIDNAGILLVMHAGIKGVENAKARIPEIRAKLQEVYVETGVHPKQVQEIITSGKIDPKEDIIDTIDRVKEEIKQTLPVESVEQVKGEQNAKQETVQTETTIEGKTSIKNATVDAERAAAGLPPIESPVGKSTRTGTFEEVKAMVDSGEINPKELARKINNMVDIGERPLQYSNEVTNNALLYDKQRIKNEQKSLEGNLNNPENMKRYMDLQEQFDANQKASKAIGTEQGKALQSRQNEIETDYSLSAMLNRSRQDGVEITPEIFNKYKELSDKITKAEGDLAKLNESIAQANIEKTIKIIKNEQGLKQRKQKREVKKEELDAEFDKLIGEFAKTQGSQFGSMLGGIDTANTKILINLAKNRIQKGIVKAEDIVDSIHVALKNAGIEYSKREIRDAISQYGVMKEMSKDEISVQLRNAKQQMRLISKLEDIQAGEMPKKSGFAKEPESVEVKQLKREVAQAMRESGFYDQTRLENYRKYRENQIVELERRIKEKDFSKTKREPLELSEKELSIQYKLDSVKKQYEKARMEDLLSQREGVTVLKDSVFESLNLIKAIKSSFDLSAPFRQGMYAFLSHPIKGFKNIPEMFRALGSEEGAYRIDKTIQGRANYKLYNDANILTERGGGKKAEEMYRSRWAKAIPGIPASERSFTSFLNLMRADLFDSMHKYAFENKKATPEEIRALGDYVNTATGRGTAKGYEKALSAWGDVLWAPKLVLSRFQMILGKDLMPGGERTAATRKAVAREYARILGSIALIYTVNNLLGNEVETDPRSSDFGKIRIGETRIDPLAGVSQATVFMSRVAIGETKSIKTGAIKHIRGDYAPYGGTNTWDVITNFMRTKLTPALGLGINVLTGKNIVGEKVTLYDIPQEALVPLAINDIYEAMNEQGVPAGLALGTLGMFGVGIQTYEQKGAGR
jgi:hypothetical protein